MDQLKFLAVLCDSSIGAGTPFAGTQAVANQENRGTAVAKYSPPISQDTMMRNNTATSVQTKCQCITAMNEYENFSLEELRLADYTIGRNGPQPGVGFGAAGGVGTSGIATTQTATGGLFGTTTSTPSQLAPSFECHIFVPHAAVERCGPFEATTGPDTIGKEFSPGSFQRIVQAYCTLLVSSQPFQLYYVDEDGQQIISLNREIDGLGAVERGKSKGKLAVVIVPNALQAPLSQPQANPNQSLVVANVGQAGLSIGAPPAGPLVATGLTGNQNAATQSLFGNGGTTQSLFGAGSTLPIAATSCFGNGSVQMGTTSALFGGNNGAQISASRSLFGTATTGGLFGTSGGQNGAPPQSFFGNTEPPARGLFGQPTQNGAISFGFGSNQTGTAPALFGNTGPPSSSLFANSGPGPSYMNSGSSCSFFGNSGAGQGNAGPIPSSFGNAGPSPSLFGNNQPTAARPQFGLAPGNVPGRTGGVSGRTGSTRRSLFQSTAGPQFFFSATPGGFTFGAGGTASSSSLFGNSRSSGGLFSGNNCRGRGPAQNLCGNRGTQNFASSSIFGTNQSSQPLFGTRGLGVSSGVTGSLFGTPGLGVQSGATASLFGNNCHSQASLIGGVPPQPAGGLFGNGGETHSQNWNSGNPGASQPFFGTPNVRPVTSSGSGLGARQRTTIRVACGIVPGQNGCGISVEMGQQEQRGPTRISTFRSVRRVIPTANSNIGASGSMGNSAGGSGDQAVVDMEVGCTVTVEDGETFLL